MVISFITLTISALIARWLVPKFVIVEIMFIFVVGVSYHVALVHRR